MKVYYDSDADLNLIKNKKAYYRLRKSRSCSCLKFERQWCQGCCCCIKRWFSSVDKAKKDGFKVLNVEMASKWADICMVLVRRVALIYILTI